MKPGLRIVIEWKLPCGHLLSIAAAAEADLPPGEPDRVNAELVAVVHTLVDRCDYWLANRAPRHRCDLVSEANSNGLENFRPTPP